MAPSLTVVGYQIRRYRAAIAPRQFVSRPTVLHTACAEAGNRHTCQRLDRVPVLAAAKAGAERATRCRSPWCRCRCGAWLSRCLNCNRDTLPWKSGGNMQRACMDCTLRILLNNLGKRVTLTCHAAKADAVIGNGRFLFDHLFLGFFGEGPCSDLFNSNN